MVNESIARAMEKEKSGKTEDPDGWEYGDGDQTLIDKNTVDGRTMIQLYFSLADFPQLFQQLSTRPFIRLGRRLLQQRFERSQEVASAQADDVG